MTTKGLENLPVSGPSSIAATLLGPLVTGIMIEQFLLGIIFSQTVMYFRYHFSNDGTFCRTIVVCIVLSSIFMGILDLILYRSLVCDYGDSEKFDIQDWTTWIDPSLTAWIAFVAHIFYISRCWAVTHSLVVCVFLGVVALCTLVSGIIATVFCFSLGRFSKLVGAVVPATIWYILTVICDLGIAGVLVIYLWRRGSVLRSINSVIIRLRRTSMETGSVTAICALLNLILFVLMPEKGYAMVIHYSMSQLYTLSVLYTLLGRQDLRNILHEGSGTFVSGFRSSFLASSVLSTTSLDNRFNSEAARLRSKTSHFVEHNNYRSTPKQSQGEDSV